jgi:MFS family permease
VPRNPQSDRSLRQFMGLSSFQVMAMFRRGLFYAYLSVYLRYFTGLTVTETTLFATLPMLANILCQNLVWGRLSDRYQLRKTFIIRGEVLGGIGILAVWYAHTLAGSPRLAGYIVIGGLTVVEAFWSMSNIGWSALIADLYPARERGSVQGRLTSVGACGRIAGVLVGGLLYDGLGRQYEGWGFQHGALFFVAAGVMFLSTVPMAFLPEGGVRSPSAAAPANPAHPPASSAIGFAIFLAAMALINFGRNSVVVVQSQYLFLATGFAVSSRTLSNIFNTESAAMIIVGLLAGPCLRRIGNRWGLFLGTGLALIYLLTFALADRLAFIFGASFLKGGAEALIMAASYVMASLLIPPAKRGRLFGLFNATYFLSWGVAGTLIAGPLVDYQLAHGTSAVSAYRMAYWAAFGLTACGVGLMGFLAVWLIPRLRRRGSQPLTFQVEKAWPRSEQRTGTPN